MSRAAGGTYTLPAGNPVVTDEVIDSSDFNDTMNDLALEMTDSLNRSGKGAMLSALKITDGSVSSGGLQFSADANTGLYRSATDAIDIIAGGASVIRAENAIATLLKRTHISNSNAVDLTDSEGALVIGALAGQHIEFSAADIVSKSNATTAGDLTIGKLGGSVYVGPQTGAGAAHLYTSGTLRLSTTVDGADVFGTILDLVNPANTATYGIVRNTSGGISLSVVAGGEGRLYQTDSAGAVEDTWLMFTRNGTVNGYFNNILNWFGEAQGFNIQSTTGTSTLLDFLDSAGTLEGRIITASAGQMQIRAELSNRGITLIGSDSGGADSNLFNALPDGIFSLYYDNTLNLFGAAQGIGVQSTTGTSTTIALYSSAAALEGLIATASSGQMQVRAELSNRGVTLIGSDSGGSDSNLFDGLPDGAATLYYDNTASIATASIATNGTGGTVTDGGGTARPIGFNVTPITSISAGTDLRIANSGHQLYATASLAVDIDTTTDSAPNGSVWVVANESGGNITITATGVTLRWFDGAAGGTGTRTMANYGYATITKRANGLYQIVGAGLS